MFNVPSFFGFKGGSQTPFQFTVDTTQSGVSSTDQFTLPLTTSTGLDCFVYWGNGSYDNITSHTAPEVTHTYPSGGTYTIKITGDLLGWQFNNGGDKLKMGEIQKWGALNISTNGGFYGCTNMTCIATDAPTITSTDLNSYFRSCTNFNGAIGNWDTSSVTNISYMFLSASLFNQDIGGWDVSNVNDFGGASNNNVFTNASSFNNGGSPSINNWDVSNVTSFRGLFRNASSFNQPIGNWNVSNVSSMDSAFNGASSFNQNIGSWNVSKVTNFLNMFSNATAFNNGGSDNIDNWTLRTDANIRMDAMFGGSNTTTSCKFNRYIGSWNTERVTNMSSMFLNNTAFNQDIGSWDTSNVTLMNLTFGKTTSFNQDLGSWDTSSVTTMNRMFWNATSFNNNGNSSINNWDVSSVIDMGGSSNRGMFYNTPFNQPIGNWDTSSVTNMRGMFRDNTVFNQDISNWDINQVGTFDTFLSSTLSTTNYDLLLVGWEANLQAAYPGGVGYPYTININFGGSQYTLGSAAEAARLRLTDPTIFAWTITDGGGV